MKKFKNFFTDFIILFAGILVGTLLQSDPFNLLSGFSVIYIRYLIPLALFIFAIAIIITKNR